MFVVAGANGNIGSELIPQLLERGEEVRALVRDGAGAARVPEGAEPVTGDLGDGSSLRDAFAGAEGVFLLSGYDDAGIVAELERAGVARAVLLSSSAAPTGRLENAVARYHIESERALEASSVAATFVRPNAFMSNALGWRDQLRAGDVVRDSFGDVAIATNDPADVAAVAAVALTTPDHEGEALRVTGPEAITLDQRVAILGDVLGRDLRFDGFTNEEAREDMSASMPEPYVDAFFEFFVEGIVDETTVLPTVEEVTGRPPGTFRAWAEAHADAFR
jgi:uncharacterized protein YbjT (DUF2867 family)